MGRPTISTRMLFETLAVVALCAAGVRMSLSLLFPWLGAVGVLAEAGLLAATAGPILLWRLHGSAPGGSASDDRAPDAAGGTESGAVERSERRQALLEGAAVGLILVMTGLVAVLGVWQSANRTVEQGVRDELARLARAAASVIDADLHSQLTSADMIDGPLYEEAIAPLRRMLRSVPGIRYMYTAVRDGADVRFVLDAAEPGDADNDGVEDRAGVWEIYEDADPTIFIALGQSGLSGHTATTPEPYTDKWGAFMTGFAPFHFRDGRQAGVVGVDIDAASHMEQLRLARLDAMLGIIPAIVVATGAGFAVYTMRRRNRAAARETRAAVAALGVERARLASFVEHAPAAIAMLDCSLRYLAVSQRWLEEYKLTGQEILGRTHYEVFPNIPERWREIHQRCLAGSVERCDDDVWRPEGWDHDQHLRWEVRPWRDSAGAVTGIMMFTQDVTEAVAAERTSRLVREGAEALARIAAIMADQRSLRERFDEALLALTELQPQSTAAVYTFTAPDRTLRLLHAAGARRATGSRADEEAERAVREVVSQTGELVAQADAGTEDGTEGGGRYVVPLLHARRCEGVVVLTSAAPLLCEEARLKTLREIGEVMALAIVRERASEMLVEAREKAEAATRAKSEFLANMSHEIRTPMTAILGYTDLLEESGEASSGDAERSEVVGTIRRNGEHLLAIINDILDLSKIEAQKMTVERIETSVPQIVEDLASLMGARAAGKGIALAVEYATPVPEMIRSDPTRLRQILLNLLGNAIKFTETGSVTLRVSLGGGESGASQLRFEVIDTGIGLAPEAAARIFEPFNQADASTTRKFGGTGLGLPISASLARMLGGEITVRSELGRGSAFTLTIDPGPVDEANFVRDPRRTARGAASAATANGAAEGRPLADARILLAEDSPDNQRLICFHLRRAGATVDVAENGEVALAMLKEREAAGNPYDLLLTDMQMPRMDGYSLARALRARGSRMPIVALTAHAMAEDRQRCLDAGCDDYATKPIDRAALIDTCRRSLGARQLGTRH